MMQNISLFKMAALLFSVAGNAFVALAQKTDSAPARPKNVILMIGDGMGISQLSAAYYYGDSAEPNFTRLPHTGLIGTSSTSKITDSAAGASAFSNGKKTRNKRISKSPWGFDRQTLVARLSKEKMNTGIIATSAITHATPAAFYAQAWSRFQQKKIARQLPRSEVDFFAGGGIGDFREKDLRRLVRRDFLMNYDSLVSLEKITAGKKAGFLLASTQLPNISEGRNDFLMRASVLGMQFLNQKEGGFFMMIEGSEIDWAGHANNADHLIQEVLDFDRALGAVLDFAEQDGETLVIVTADHETGGFTLAAAEKQMFGGRQADYDIIEPRFSTGGHSAALVPVLAFGPSAELFGGIYENTGIYCRILEVLGL